MENTVFCCLHRLRFKSIEKSNIDPDEILIYDTFETEFMSTEYEKAKEYYDSIEPCSLEHIRSISKYLITIPLNKKIEEGLVNEDCIESMDYEDFTKYKEELD